MYGCNTREQRAKDAVKTYLKKTLRDPESLKIYSIETQKKDNDVTYIVTVDYGAKNGFGGMERKTDQFTVIGDEVMIDYFKR